MYMYIYIYIYAHTYIHTYNMTNFLKHSHTRADGCVDAVRRTGASTVAACCPAAWKHGWSKHGSSIIP